VRRCRSLPGPCRRRPSTASSRRPSGPR
jgi:hypothetical protein